MPNCCCTLMPATLLHTCRGVYIRRKLVHEETTARKAMLQHTTWSGGLSSHTSAWLGGLSPAATASPPRRSIRAACTLCSPTHWVPQLVPQSELGQTATRCTLLGQPGGTRCSNPPWQAHFASRIAKCKQRSSIMGPTRVGDCPESRAPEVDGYGVLRRAWVGKRYIRAVASAGRGTADGHRVRLWRIPPLLQQPAIMLHMQSRGWQGLSISART